MQNLDIISPSNLYQSTFMGRDVKEKRNMRRVKRPSRSKDSGTGEANKISCDMKSVWVSHEQDTKRGTARG